MFKVKNIAASAIIGFILSFIISIIATHKFINSCGRAFFTALVFALLVVLIEFISNKFLDSGEEALMADNNLENKGSNLKSSVDITISDEPLTEDESPLQFDVKGNKRTLSSENRDVSKKNAPNGLISDVGENMNNIPEARNSAGLDSLVQRENGAEPLFSGEQNDSGNKDKQEKEFKPVNLGQKVDGDASENENQAKKSSGTDKEAERNIIADLPDMDNMIQDEESGSSSSVDSSFYEEDSVPDENFTRNKSASGKPKAASQDTETMAKAIRTLLNKD